MSNNTEALKEAVRRAPLLKPVGLSHEWQAYFDAVTPLHVANLIARLEQQHQAGGMMDPLLQYAAKRIIELESLLLVDVPETVWPAEVSMVFGQVESAGAMPAHHQRRLKHHINRMWLEKMPVPAIITAARSLADAMENYA
jgi:hypothetical protein